MRSAKPSIVIGAVCALAFSTVAVAGALITGSSGQVVWLPSAPPSVAVDAQQNATSAIAFDERQATTLTAAVLVDAVNPGTYSVFPNGTAKIAAGTEVDSHLIHSDPPTRTSTQHRIGTVSFSTDILGVIGSTGRLAKSDAALGAPGTTYAGGANNRGLEQGGPGAQDTFTISGDRRTLSFDIRTLDVIDEIRVITKHTDALTTTMSDTPDPVTVSNNVQYSLVVTNAGYEAVTSAHVVDTLPAGTTFVTASPGCSGTGPVDCALGLIAVAQSVTVKIVVTSPATVPVGGTITNSAIASPGDQFGATETTTVKTPDPDVSIGFVLPGASIGTTGDQPAAVTLPGAGCVNPPDGLHPQSWPCSDGDGAPVSISQDNGTHTFCGGQQCNGPVTSLNTPDGFFDPTHPMILTETYTFNAEDYPGDPNAAANAALNAAAYAAYGSTFWKQLDNDPVDVGHQIPACPPGPVSDRVLGDYPDPVGACVASRSTAETSFGHYVSTIEIDWLSTDGRIARH